MDSRIEGVVIKELKPIRDDRGEVCELLRSDDELFVSFGQLYYTTVNAGVVKAWHYQSKQTDHLLTVGPRVIIVLYDRRDSSTTHGNVIEVRGGREAPVLVRIPPGVCHGFMAEGNQDAMILNVPTELYDYDDPDEFRIDPFDSGIPFDWRALGANRGK